LGEHSGSFTSALPQRKPAIWTSPTSVLRFLMADYDRQFARLWATREAPRLNIWTHLLFCPSARGASNDNIVE
jgi:hypothetical protein